MNIDGQNKQQSNLSVSLQLMLIGRGDLLTYYSLQLFCLIMSLLVQSVAPLYGGGEAGDWVMAWCLGGSWDLVNI